MARARRAAVCLSLAAVTLIAQPAAETGDALPFAKSYTVTGNYVVVRGQSKEDPLLAEARRRAE